MSNTDWKTTLFGANVLTKEGVKPTTEVFASKKFIGIYFSASWCPPCRTFTPQLISLFSAFLQHNKDTLEIIFVSSDSDTKSFEEYFGSMPWVSLPFDQTPKKDELSSKFGIKSIPSLIIINGETGDLIDANGRGTISCNNGNNKRIMDAWAK